MFERHKCDNCGRKFRKIEELMQHQQLMHEQSLYVCNRCNASFEGMEQMRDHAKKFHSYHHKRRVSEKEKKNQTALSCFTIGGLAFRNTRKPHIHFISGSLESSSTVTRVPQRMHSYATEISPPVDSNCDVSLSLSLGLSPPHFKLYRRMLMQALVLLYG